VKSNLDNLMKAYGIRPGDSVGIMGDRPAGAQRLADLLDWQLCRHVLLDPGEALVSLSSKVVRYGIRMVFVWPESRNIGEKLPLCVGLADAFLEKANHV